MTTRGPICFHVTSVANRASIETHGLDWRHMGSAQTVAGGEAPELDGIWLCETEWEVEYFAGMASSVGIEAVDVWEVTLPPGGELIEDEAGYRYYPEPVPIERLRLIRRDWSVPSPFRD